MKLIFIIVLIFTCSSCYSESLEDKYVEHAHASIIKRLQGKVLKRTHNGPNDYYWALSGKNIYVIRERFIMLLDEFDKVTEADCTCWYFDSMRLELTQIYSVLGEFEKAERAMDKSMPVNR